MASVFLFTELAGDHACMTGEVEGEVEGYLSPCSGRGSEAATSVQTLSLLCLRKAWLAIIFFSFPAAHLLLTLGAIAFVVW